MKRSGRVELVERAKELWSKNTESLRGESEEKEKKKRKKKKGVSYSIMGAAWSKKTSKQND